VEKATWRYRILERWPCDGCGRDVGINSVQSTVCQKCAPKKCSGMKGRMFRISKSLHVEAVQINQLVQLGPV